MTVKELASLCGVSVRTLHYYDQIGLLRPGELTGAGYRIYGDSEAEQLQQILFFREMGFPLAEIRDILSDPSFDRREALRKQSRLLQLERERLNRLIGLVERNLRGEKDMSMKEFDRSEIDATLAEYRKEAKEKWGNTAAWKEFEQKEQAGSSAGAKEEADEIFRAFAALPVGEEASPKALTLAKRWQEHVSRYYYTCTPEILAGLAEMYTGDERFLKNIDGSFGEGTAEKISAALRAYTKQ